MLMFYVMSLEVVMCRWTVFPDDTSYSWGISFYAVGPDDTSYSLLWYLVLCMGNVSRQKDTVDKASQAMIEQPRQGRERAKSPTKSPTKSRAPSSAGRGAKQRPLKLSPGDLKAMVEKEARVVARELGERPSPALIALNDARRDMDDMATRAQVRSYYRCSVSHLQQYCTVLLHFV